MFMKYLLPLLFCLVSLTSTSQITWEGTQCYYIDDNGDEVEVPCDHEYIPTPVFTGKYRFSLLGNGKTFHKYIKRMESKSWIE